MSALCYFSLSPDLSYKEWLEKNKTEKADSDNEDNVPQKHRGSKFARRRQAKLGNTTIFPNIYFAYHIISYYSSYIS